MLLYNITNIFGKSKKTEGGGAFLIIFGKFSRVRKFKQII